MPARAAGMKIATFLFLSYPVLRSSLNMKNTRELILWLINRRAKQRADEVLGVNVNELLLSWVSEIYL